VYEDKLVRSPQTEIAFSDNFKAIAILDKGNEVNLLSERVYTNLAMAGIDVPTLPLEGVVLITAFGKRSNEVGKQAVIEFTIGDRPRHSSSG
jgi:hypothetical protein